MKHLLWCRLYAEIGMQVKLNFSNTTAKLMVLVQSEDVG